MYSLTQRLLLQLVPPLAYRYVRWLHWTMQVGYRNQAVIERARGERGPYLLACWHSRWLLMPYAHPEGRLTVMTSWHFDSELLVRAMSRFGVEFVRGSSTRGGTEASRNMIRAVRSGSDAIMTVDGPKGPRRRVKPGVIMISRVTGAPIVPVAFSASRARRLASWDMTLVPRAFSRGLVSYGEPLTVPRDADREQERVLQLELEYRLDVLTDALDREVGMPTEPARVEDAA